MMFSLPYRWKLFVCKKEKGVTSWTNISDFKWQKNQGTRIHCKTRCFYDHLIINRVLPSPECLSGKQLKQL
ncbi:hypothetical protein I79_013409 [Cricetulus griseus]|uniref:Uncharacterized protein n=1 Tax=Cricetulus griseus TaxID=10029 RepID=G3HRE3_CRIGR|nr:hypothetical protein I79_013409 [Cricetulus griseus]